MMMTKGMNQFDFLHRKSQKCYVEPGGCCCCCFFWGEGGEGSTFIVHLERLSIKLAQNLNTQINITIVPIINDLRRSTVDWELKRSCLLAVPKLKPELHLSWIAEISSGFISRGTLQIPVEMPPAVGSCGCRNKSSGEKQSLNVPHFKAWSRSVYSHTCHAYCQGLLPCLFLPFRSIHLHFF